MVDVILDGFWGPVHVRSGEPGRPEHMPTDANRQKIVLSLALGWTQLRIAAALGLTVKTLRKHYSPQLAARTVALDRLKLERLTYLFSQVRAGNVGAIKEMGKVIEAVEAATFGMGPIAQQPAREMSEPRAVLGKKEAARLAADGAGQGTDWGDDLQGHLVN